MPVFDKSLVKSDFERAAHRYNKNAELQKNVAGKIHSMAENVFAKNSLILDIGSGTGFFARENEKWNIYQTDIAYSMCSISSKYSPAINADMDVLPFNDSAFHGVVSSLAMQWVNTEKTIKEVSRVLKSGGKFLFSTLGTDTLRELKDVFNKVNQSSHVSDFVSKKTLEKELQDSGFCDININSNKVTFFYPTALDLMKSVKAVGGSNKQADRKAKISKKILSKVEDVYKDEYGMGSNIPATWEVIYVSAVLR